MQKNWGKKYDSRKSIRKPYKSMQDLNNKVLFLYGKFRNKQVARGYCKLHRCYLEAKDITEKSCSKKNCKYFEGKGNKDVI